MDIATPSGGGDGEVINGSTRFFPLLYPFPRISLNITRRRIFAAERRSQLKLSRIAESTRDLCFPRFPPLPPCFKIGELQSRGRTWKDTFSLRKILFQFAKILLPLLRSGSVLLEFVQSLRRRFIHHFTYHSGWKLLQFRIHRLTQLPRGYVSITVLPSLPSSGGEEEVMERF